MLALCLASACRERKEAAPPWGTSAGDTTRVGGGFTMDDIMANGELIMLTLTGPDTYYDYHGSGMGTQYLLCEKFAMSIGVRLRVDVCRDTAEVLRRLSGGEGDIAALLLPVDTAVAHNFLGCGVAIDSLDVRWAVNGGNNSLAQALDKWFSPAVLDAVRAEERQRLSSRIVNRPVRVSAPFIDRKKGVISRYDGLFRKHAPTIRWDWRLLAAQCYQESAFQPTARSWAGACGLMQIMPSTAQFMGLPMSKIYDPEANISAAVKCIKQLNDTFSDIPDAQERRWFVLAAYNGGALHIRDAMALAAKDGRKAPYRWRDIERYVLLLRQPQYYNDPVVKHGYMRGDETVGYVRRIRELYAQYNGSAHVSGAAGSLSSGGSLSPVTPRKATKKHRFRRRQAGDE